MSKVVIADVFAELVNLAARVRRRVARAFPPGTVVAWTDSTRRTLDLTGTVNRVVHDRFTGAVRLHVIVTGEQWTGKSKGFYSEVGRGAEVDPALVRVVTADTPAGT